MLIPEGSVGYDVRLGIILEDLIWVNIDPGGLCLEDGILTPEGSKIPLSGRLLYDCTLTLEGSEGCGGLLRPPPGQIAT